MKNPNLSLRGVKILNLLTQQFSLPQTAKAMLSLVNRNMRKVSAENTHTNTNTYTHTYAHAHTHARTHTHTLTHT